MFFFFSNSRGRLRRFLFGLHVHVQGFRNGYSGSCVDRRLEKRRRRVRKERGEWSRRRSNILKQNQPPPPIPKVTVIKFISALPRQFEKSEHGHSDAVELRKACSVRGVSRHPGARDRP